MSITTNDLDEIRNIIETSLAKQSQEVVKTIQGELEALGNDVKEMNRCLLIFLRVQTVSIISETKP